MISLIIQLGSCQFKVLRNGVVKRLGLIAMPFVKGERKASKNDYRKKWLPLAMMAKTNEMHAGTKERINHRVSIGHRWPLQSSIAGFCVQSSICEVGISKDICRTKK